MGTNTRKKDRSEKSHEILLGATPGAKRIEKNGEFLRDLRATYRMARRNDLSLLSASVAFFCLLSICPFLILCFLGAHYFVGDAGGESSRELNALIEALIPNINSSFSNNLIHVMRKNVVSNAFSIALLVWSNYELFATLQRVFAKISMRGDKRNILFSNLISMICFLIVGGASTIFLLLFTTKAAVLQTMFVEYLGRFSVRSINYMAAVICLLCVTGSLTFLFKVMPLQRVGLRHALRGSFLFLSLFLFGRGGYQMYLKYYAYLNVNVYGSFFTFIVLIVWVYYLASIFLFSAQYAIYLEEKPRVRNR